MRNLFFLFLALLFTVSTTYSQPWFSAFPNNHAMDTVTGPNTGFCAARMSTGGFVTAEVNTAGNVVYRTYTADMTPVGAWQYSTAYTEGMVSQVHEFKPGIFLVTGRMNAMVNAFFLYYFDSNTTLSKTAYFGDFDYPYTKGPKIATLADTIYVLIPEYEQHGIQKLSATLSTYWGKTIYWPSPGIGKSPAFDFHADSSGVFLTAKDDSLFSFIHITPGGQLDAVHSFSQPGRQYTRMYGVDRAQNGDLLFCGFSDLDSMSIYLDEIPVLMRTDTSGTVIWSKTIPQLPDSGYMQFTDVYELPDGKIAVLHSNDIQYQDLSFSRIVLYDSAGNPLKTISFKDSTSSYEFTEFKPYDDGILISGIRYPVPSGSPDNFILFTDYNFSAACYIQDTIVGDSLFDPGVHTSLPTSVLAVMAGGIGTVSSVAPPISETVVIPDFCSFIVSTQEQKPFPSFETFPNPVSSGEYFTLRASAPGPYTFRIADVAGKELQSGELRDSETILCTEGLQAGLYLVSIQSQEGFFCQKLIIK